MEVTAVQWHPTDKNTILTSSLDGSLRLFDLLGEAHFGQLTSKHVLKMRGTVGQSRLGAMSCCFSPDGTNPLSSIDALMIVIVIVSCCCAFLSL